MGAGGGAGDERVDVVDADDRVLRIASRAEVRAQRLRHRCAFVVVRSSEGAVLVHRRAPWKDLWPDRWDVAVGGVVAAGEAWLDAAARELAEEVGVTGVELTEIARAVYDDDRVSEVARVYLTVSDGPFDLVDDEVAEVAWIAPHDLAAWVAAHELVPDSTALVLPILLAEVPA